MQFLYRGHNLLFTKVLEYTFSLAISISSAIEFFTLIFSWSFDLNTKKVLKVLKLLFFGGWGGGGVGEKEGRRVEEIGEN